MANELVPFNPLYCEVCCKRLEGEVVYGVIAWQYGRALITVQLLMCPNCHDKYGLGIGPSEGIRYEEYFGSRDQWLTRILVGYNKPGQWRVVEACSRR